MKKYPKPARLKGWDFSQLKVTEEGPRIEYINITKALLNTRKTLLDVGTGGAEKFSTVAPRAKTAIAIDVDPNMLKIAADNLHKTHLSNTHLVLCDSDKLPLAASTVDVATDRHAPFNPEEIGRILKPNGVFITQQVSEGDKQNVKQIFKRGQHYGEKTGTRKKAYVKQLRQAGLRVIRHRTVSTTEYYETMRDVIFLLSHTPVIPDFNFEKEQDELQQIERTLMAKKGIKTNSERYLIIATKKAETPKRH